MTYRERQLLRRAETIHRKTMDLADEVAKVLGENSAAWPLAANLVCFAAELAHGLGRDDEEQSR